MISAELMQSKTTGFAALTTDLSITTHMDVLVPCRELSRRLSEEMPLGCEGHAPRRKCPWGRWPRAVNFSKVKPLKKRSVPLAFPHGQEGSAPVRQPVILIVFSGAETALEHHVCGEFLKAALHL